ncbi:MAG TPA: AbrB/MazE/SpoVT family DNA-binding domain-containing protein [Chloroflexota bacterium]|nr:AbrB/MazE/SpoVT family DNA-binding domain-containing protein [Chloroflexota bacterium]
MSTVKIDGKGRLTVPASERVALGIKPGDVLFVERRGRQLIYVKAENPFDVLADDAIEEYRRGETRSLRKIAELRGITIDAE